jgi:hypothetical protein
MTEKIKIIPRGKTQRFVLNEEFIFGGKRCWKCRKVMGKNETGLYCQECRRKSNL